MNEDVPMVPPSTPLGSVFDVDMTRLTLVDLDWE
jgi:hypothetical protein